MLVSIIVITYNSSKYIIETLESCYRQTQKRVFSPSLNNAESEFSAFPTPREENVFYIPNNGHLSIELIISDDCSKDDTFLKCKQWLKTHSDRFSRTICTQTPHNGGICWNYNHALKYVKGDYIKYIAGDDILKPNCIERYIVNLQPDAFLYTCVTERLCEDGSKRYFSVYSENTTAKEQLRNLLNNRYIIEGSTIFIEREHLSEYGGFDLQYPMLEDYPLIYKFLSHNQRFYVVEENLVTWRCYQESVSHSNSQFNSQFNEDFMRSHRFYHIMNCLKYGYLFQWYNSWLERWIIAHKNKGALYRFLGYFFRCFDVNRLKGKLFSSTPFCFHKEWEKDENGNLHFLQVKPIS